MGGVNADVWPSQRPGQDRLHHNGVHYGRIRRYVPKQLDSGSLLLTEWLALRFFVLAGRTFVFRRHLLEDSIRRCSLYAETLAFRLRESLSPTLNLS